MDYKIVLGFPYDGALLWLLSAEQHYHKTIKECYDGSHPYYLTLFGKNHNLLIDKTVSLSLLYDDIYLAPTDTYLPERNKYFIESESGSGYANHEWGIYTNSEWVKDIDQWGDGLDLLEKDIVISQILNKVPFRARRQIIHDAINQIHIANQFDTAILAIPSYLKLCKRINTLTNPNAKELKTINSITPSNAVEKVFNISSLKFEIDTLDDFVTLKKSNSIREYSNSFRNYISELPNGKLDDKGLLKAMLEAMNKDDISNKISGGFSLLTSLISMFSWIPGTQFLGLATDGISRLSNSYSDNKKWWLLAPEISKELTKKRIEEIYNQSR